MDRIIQKKVWYIRHRLVLAGVTLMLCIVCSSYYFAPSASSFNISRERISISEAKQGLFKEYIPVNGIVLPLTTIYLDAVEGGRVEEVYAEDGAIMKKGEPVLKLANTDLELSLANQETAVFNLLTQMRIARNASAQNTVMKQNQRLDTENALKEAERVYQLNKKLYEQRAISQQELKLAENTYTYALEKRKLNEQVLSQDELSTREELAQAAESYKRSQRSLEIMRRKVDDLVVRAPIDGQLTSLDAEQGQNKNKGQRLGQVDVNTGFKVRVDIDEHYISRIYTGLMGEFTLSGKTYSLKISKVYTQVSNRRFQVDMLFEDKALKGVRRGQSLQIKLALSDESRALLVPRGSFYQQSGGNYIFKLNATQTKAFKVAVELGRQNPQFFEVVNGLQPGDKVITSSYETYGQADELNME